MVLRVSAESSKEVRTLISAMKLMDRDIARETRAYAKKAMDPIVNESLKGHATTRLQVRGIVDTTRVKVSDQNVTVKAGAVKGKFSGGLDARRSIKALEFGGSETKTKTYGTRSKRGKPYKVTRHTMRQLGPRAKSGNTFYPAVGDMAPRVVSLYIQTLLRTIHESIENR